MKKRIGFFVVIALFHATGLFAEGGFLKTSLFDIELNPSEFYGKNVEIRASFYKESGIWVNSLPNASDYIGFFVIKSKGDNPSSILGEYFGFVFAPKEMKSQIRMLKQGDKLTIRGKCFEFKSTSIEGPGIEVAELLSGWGEEATPLQEVDSVSVTMKEISGETVQPAEEQAVPQPEAVTSKYDLYLNGKVYEGLRVGDEYVFEGIRFRVEQGAKGE